LQPPANGFTPYNLGVTATHGDAPRFVVVTWSVAAVWLDELDGFRVSLYEEEPVDGPDTFVPAVGWQGTLLRPVTAGRALRAVDVGTPPDERLYRLTISLPAPTAGQRVRAELAAVGADGSESPLAAATSREGNTARR
jgi:hypothetical protein